MTFPNIALMGRLRSGKDVCAAYLADKYGYTRFAFGDELKRDFHRRYPEIPRDPKPRAGYQFHGQFMREHYGEPVWVGACLDSVRDAELSADLSDTFMGVEEPSFRAVITDVRQPNEYSALKSAGYTLIRVECPDAIRIARAQDAGDTFTHADLAHPTETALDGYAADFTVINDRGLAELYAQIDVIVAELTQREAV